MIVRNVVVLLVVCMSLQVQAQQTGYQVSLEVKGLEDSVAYLGYHFGGKKYLQDTSAVTPSGQVTFEGASDLKKGVYFLYTPTYYFEFVVDQQVFSVKTEVGNNYGTMTVEGSKANEYFRDFQQIMIRHQAEVRELTSSLDSTSSASDSTAVYDQVRALNRLNETQRDSAQLAYQGTFTGELLTLMNLQPGLAFSKDSLSREERQQEYAVYKQNYFEGIDFNSEGLLRTPIFESKINEYLDKVALQNPDSIIQSIDYLMMQSENNEEMYRFLLVSFFQKYQNHKFMGMDKVFVHLSDNYYLKGKADWATDEMIAELQKEMKFHRENQIGNLAPQIYLQDTLGVTHSLYSLDHDYVILYFYSPTCGHCKKKTPVLRDVYHEMEGNVEVVAVCTDTDEAKWKEFIQDLELDWINYADLGYKSNFRIQYNVRSTPVLYVLDKNKKILARKLAVEQVKGFIEDQMRMEASKDI